MKGLLLDSHIVLWFLTSPEQLSPTTLDRLKFEDSIWVSSASVWELRAKASIGKLRLPTSFEEVMQKQAFQELTLSWAHGYHMRTMPLIHRDPFDRMLIAQAACEDLILVTRDRNIQRYPIATMPG